MKCLLKQLILSFLLCFLSGCYSYTSQADIFRNSQNRIEESARSHLGKTVNDLVLRWGPPNETTSDYKDGQILTYYIGVQYSFGYFSARVLFYANSKNEIYHYRTFYSLN